ncbi:MAG: fused MFS/spermidine synthase [Armatimonadetes bacterium]|nr:fused MFS/spermidine synthase [Armatimonadota bacterium]
MPLRPKSPEGEKPPLAGLWFHDWYIPGLDYHAHTVERTLVSRQTRYQNAQIQELHHLGLCLVLDGKMQSAACDEYIYHELLVHPAMMAHPEPRRVLICGGGEGAVLREILRHRTVESVTMVDIDRELVEVCRTHLDSWHQGAFDDPRVTLLYEDARAFVEGTREAYDVAINDISDPIQGGPGTLLYTRQFDEAVRKVLTDRGVFVTQAQGIHFDRYDIFHASIRRTLATVFDHVYSYMEYIMSFDYPWTFVMGMGSPLPGDALDLDARIAQRIQGELRYYDAEAHRHAFSLPKNLRGYLGREGKIIDDRDPLVVP